MARRLIVLWGLLAASPAAAIRPTEGGLFSFDGTDEVHHWDEASGRVRVHYSVEGNNQVRQGDADEDGVPDFAQDVAETAAEVLDFYEHTLGLRAPLSEDDMGLSALGGSFAFDFYLVDFAGNGDGMFGTDTCDGSPGHCSGFMVMENDFVGYGYPNLQVAVEVLTSHELFHGVQAAYDAGQEVWFTEGTAVWAERQFDPDSPDFLWFADVYLADASRSLDRPPIGPVPSFAYSTALWWDFLTTRHDVSLMDELLEATESGSGDLLAEMADLLAARDDDLSEAWTTFASWNLATGPRAGLVDGYSFADELDGVIAEAEGASIDDDNRYYPLATTYYRLDHAGGPLWFGLEEPSPTLVFALHPVADGASDGPVEDALDSWSGDLEAARAVAEGVELDAGGYWLMGTQPVLADESVKVRTCLGDATAAEVCAPLPEVEQEEPPTSCGCSGLGSPAVLWWLPMVLLSRRRRAPHL